MNQPHPERLALDVFPRNVLVVAPRPEDGVLACGGVLAQHAARGDRVRVLVVTDGAGDEHGADRSELAAGLEAESRAAAAALQLEDPVFLGRREGSLGGDPELVELLRGELERVQPELVYGPSPLEPTADARAASAAMTAALTVGPRRRVALFGPSHAAATAIVDTSATRTQKEEALSRFTSLGGADLLARAETRDRSWTRRSGAAAAVRAEGFVLLGSGELADYKRKARAQLDGRTVPAATAVISTWNKCDDVCANIEALYGQVRPFDDIVVVDNASEDGTAQKVRERFPDVNLIVMPHSRYGACETFNVGFASSSTELTAILDDDVVLPPDWLEKTVDRLLREPPSTAIVSTKIIEPGMPDAYRDSPALNTERYMSTFRGCASLARTEALQRAGGYDERLFIYGNERDLTCRLLNLGYRVLQFPAAEAFHKTPFGIKMGKRSLYYHARNAWLAMLKYAPLGDLLKMPLLVVGKVLLRRRAEEQAGGVTDATGTIGIGRSIRETPGAWWVLIKAAGSVLYNVPYCLKHREPVRAEDFELPIR